MSDSLRPHRRQPTRLLRPWDSPGKNTGVGCHFLLQCMKVKSQSEAAQLCLTLSDPMDFSLPGSSHGIFQAKVHRTLINIWVAKAILVGSQMEMRNMLLNSGEKVMFFVPETSACLEPQATTEASSCPEATML